MFNREIEKELKEWKNKPDRKPLVLRGARQTGKTTLIRKFSGEFKYFVELNLEKDAAKKIFSEIRDIKEIVQSIEGLKNIKIVPGETLLFLDEIQNSINAIRILRYFYEEIPSLHVIAAGSLLEVRMKKEGWSFPVGRVEFLYLYPVSFKEFLTVLGEGVLLEKLSGCSVSAPVPVPIHEKALNLLASYLIVGGMPEAVKAFLATEKFNAAREIHEMLNSTFKEDFARYSKKNEVEYLKLVWDQLPCQIGKRIKYTKIAPVPAASKQISGAFDILHEAMLAERVYPSTAVSLPPIKKAKAAPKAIMLDIGLCAHVLNLAKDLILEKLINPVFEGGMFEGLVGQEILCLDAKARHPLFFWIREEKGASSELDYLITVFNRLVPLEVKAGSQGSLKSLHQFLSLSGQKLGVRVYNRQLRLDQHRVTLPTGETIEYKLLSLPFYLVFRIRELIREE
jgi:predicted AAA+ superfamily ATPase